MQEPIYRYRPMKSVLGEFQELEKQEIYFASIYELNDPMEGFVSPFYKGCDIHWIYLLKFYFMEVFDKYTKKYHSGIYISKEHFDDIMNRCLEIQEIQQFFQEAEKSTVHYTASSVNMLFQYIFHPYIYYCISSDMKALSGKRDSKTEEQKNKAIKCWENKFSCLFKASGYK